MLYLIGGTPRTGKSLLSVKLVRRRPMHCISTDVVRRALFEVAPQLGVDPNSAFPEKQRRFEPYLMSMATNSAKHFDALAIEGDVILPKHVVRLRRKHDVACVFLGRTEVDMTELRGYNDPHSWLEQVDDHERTLIAGRMERFSRHLRRECHRHDLPFIDMSSGPFKKMQKSAFDALAGQI